MSGAGMSFCGPIAENSSDVNRRVSRSSSVARQRVRVAAHAALRAAVRQAQERALPRHPRAQRRALAERDLGVVADAALRRPEHGRVLDAVAGEDLPAAVVAAERHAHDEGPLREAQPLGHHRRDVRVRQRLLELRARHEEQRRVPLERALRERRIPLERALERRCLDSGHARSVVPCRTGTVDTPGHLRSGGCQESEEEVALRGGGRARARRAGLGARRARPGRPAPRARTGSRSARLAVTSASRRRHRLRAIGAGALPYTRARDRLRRRPAAPDSVRHRHRPAAQGGARRPAAAFVVGGSCFAWLHTHAADGVVHIESPTKRTYTLGNFFDVWGR